MNKLYLDLAISLFFLTALVLVSRSKEKIRQRHETSFGLLSAGLCILALLSIYTMVQNQLVEAQILRVPYVAVAEFVRLIMLVAGLVLMTSGISKWLPVFEQNKIETPVSHKVIEELSSSKQLAVLLAKESTLEEFIRASLVYLTENFGLSSGAVYSILNNKSVANLVAVTGSNSTVDNFATKFLINSSWLEELTPNCITHATVGFSELNPEVTGKCHCFCVKASNNRRFLYLVWSGEASLNEKLAFDTLFAIAETIGSKVSYRHMEIKEEFNGVCSKVALAVKTGLEKEETLNHKLVALKTSLKLFVPVDFVSICSINQSGLCRRMTVAQSDTVLNEIDIRPGPENSYLQHVLESNNAVWFDNLSDPEAAKFPAILTLSQIDSVVAVPLQGIGHSRGVITFGFCGKQSILHSEMKMLETCKPSFEALLNEMALLEQSIVQYEREKFLKDFVTELSEKKSVVEVLNLAANTVSCVVNSPIVRLSTVDASRKYLESQVLINESRTKVRTPGNANLILSLLQWHNVAVENGNTVIVNCRAGTNGMPDIETMQVFTAGVKRAVIVPIKAHDKVLGLISLADDKVVNASVLNDQNIQFTETIATLTALALEPLVSDTTALTEFASAARNEIVRSSRNRGIRSQLKSSLTSILGSLEMIKDKENHDEEQKGRFLEIIDRSAKKLSEYITE